MVKIDYGYIKITDKAVSRNIINMLPDSKHKKFLSILLSQDRIPFYFIDDLIYILNKYNKNSFARKLNDKLNQLNNKKIVTNVPYHKCTKLLDDYQIESVKKIKNILSNPNLKGIIIADEPGLAKTATSLCIAQSFRQQNHEYRILIIAQISLLSQWKYSVDKAFEIDTVIHDESENICITNFENIDNLKTEYDIIIVDECHYIHNIDSEKFKSLHTINSKSKLTILLSGTPVREDIKDLLSLYSLIDKRLDSYDTFVNIYNFVSKYSDVLYNIIIDRIKNIMVRHTKQQAFDDVGDIKERYLIIPADINELKEKKLLLSQLDKRISNEILKLKKYVSIIKKSDYSEKIFKMIHEGVDLNDIEYKIKDKILVEAIKYVVNFDKTTYKIKLSSKLWKSILFETLKYVFINHIKYIVNFIDKYGKVLIVSKSRAIMNIIDKQLNRYGKSGIIIDSKDDEIKRYEKVNKFKSNKNITFIAATYPILEAGLNFQEAKAILLCDAPYRPHSYEQIIHRTQRKNNISDDAYIYQLKISDDDILNHDDMILEKYKIETQQILEDLVTN